MDTRTSTLVPLPGLESTPRVPPRISALSLIELQRQLCQAYDAQLRYVDTMQQPAKMAQDEELKSMIQEHRRITEQQVQTLEQVFSQMGMEPSRLHTEGSKGLVADAADDGRQAQPGPVLDSMILAGQARIEAAGYNGLIVDARQLGQDDVADLLEQNREPHKRAVDQIARMAPRLEQQAAQTA